MVKARTVCKTFRVKGTKKHKGYTVTRRVHILASGKWKFVKGKCK